MLKELSLINKRLLKKEYDMLSEDLKNYTRHNIEKHINATYYNTDVIGHKERLKRFKC